MTIWANVFQQMKDYLTISTLYLASPLGAFTVTTAPLFFPMIALPMGESAVIMPLNLFARRR